MTGSQAPSSGAPSARSSQGAPAAPRPPMLAPLTGAAVLAVMRRPGLWPIAVAQGWRLRRRGWWRSPPRLPLPDPDYLRFRMITAYGGDGTVDADPADLVRYLEWCRDWHRSGG